MSTPERTLAPGDYWFEDLRENDAYVTGKIVVTEAHIVAFAGISGDFFDIHMDDASRRRRAFPGEWLMVCWALR